MTTSDSVSHLHPHPFNEPGGAGTGWDTCMPAEATKWTVEDRNGQVVGDHLTQAAAQMQIDALYGAEVFAQF